MRKEKGGKTESPFSGARPKKTKHGGCKPRKWGVCPLVHIVDCQITFKDVPTATTRSPVRLAAKLVASLQGQLGQFCVAKGLLVPGVVLRPARSLQRNPGSINPGLSNREAFHSRGNPKRSWGDTPIYGNLGSRLQELGSKGAHFCFPCICRP